MKQLIQAAEAGDLDAQFALIEKYDERGSYLLSGKWAERWEENFVKQTGLEANPEETKKWLRKAMETTQKAFPLKAEAVPKAKK